MPPQSTHSASSTTSTLRSITSFKSHIKTAIMSSKKITMKDLTIGSKQILADLRELQKHHHTLPDIIYNYRIVEGRLVPKQYREGSQSGSEHGDEEEDPEGSINAKVVEVPVVSHDKEVKKERRISRKPVPAPRRSVEGFRKSEEVKVEERKGMGLGMERVGASPKKQGLGKEVHFGSVRVIDGSKDGRRIAEHPAEEK